MITPSRHRSQHALWAGEWLTNIGRGAVSLSLAYYLFRLTGSIWAFAIACLSELVLAMALRRVCAASIRSYGPRRVLILAATGLCAILLPPVFAGDLLDYSVYLGLGAALCMNAMRVFVSAATYAAVVQYAATRIEATNAGLGVALQVGQFGGMVLAGATLEWASFNHLALFAALSYGLAAIAYAALPIQAVDIPSETPSAESGSLLGAVRHNAEAVRLSLVGATDFALVGLFNLLLAPVVVAIHAGAPRWMMLLDVSFTIGALFASALFVRVGARLSRRPWLASVLSLTAAVVAFHAIVRGAPAYSLTATAIFGTTVTASYLFWMSRAQAETPADAAGAVGALRNILNGAMLALVAGIIAARDASTADALLHSALIVVAVVATAACLLFAAPALYRAWAGDAAGLNPFRSRHQ